MIKCPNCGGVLSVYAETISVTQIQGDTSPVDTSPITLLCDPCGITLTVERLETFEGLKKLWGTPGR